MTEDKITRDILKVEKRYHAFKAALIILVSVVATIAVIYFINAKNERVERLLRCSLPAFTPKNYQNAEKIINVCLERTK